MICWIVVAVQDFDVCLKAQLVERKTVNLEVVGSISTWRVILLSFLRKLIVEATRLSTFFRLTSSPYNTHANWMTNLRRKSIKIHEILNESARI